MRCRNVFNKIVSSTTGGGRAATSAAHTLGLNTHSYPNSVRIVGVKVDLRKASEKR